ncbi:PREDICTED: putative wall-associated receptor kinase-like 13 [Camelina sativa]|uniref:Wall-associated receptor kinase-like 13 n=1 Tax=Camelina sativa TaxID=90675 RepID=A0ABM0VPV9_CAMSA|nr:PREDICTED: putative wall-associated receptor kinase-like 13 [Camelina sativa]
MNGNKNYSSLFLFSFLILPIFHSSSCTPKCGDVQIPFPFGVEDGCYLDEWYKIECRPNATSGKSFPFLPKINMEVVNIFLPVANYNLFASSPKFSSIRVKSSIASMGCSSSGEEFGSTLNLTDSPFFFGDKNYLVAVGCNNKASLTNVEPSMVGCESTCTTSKNAQSISLFNKVGCSESSYSNTQNILPNNYIPFCNKTQKQEDTICNGNGCCQAKAPDGAQQLIGVTIANTSNGNLTKGGECKVAFLTDEVYTLWNASNPELFFSNGYATVSLGWFIQTKNHSFLESLDCRNREEFDRSKRFSIKISAKCTCDNHTASGINYASCACASGYKGNPYLLDDCQDVNECARKPHNPCWDSSILYRKTCKNTPGSHECVDYHIPEVMIGLGAGFFVLIVGCGTWGLRKQNRKRRMTKRKRKFFKRNGGLLLQQQLHTTQGRVEKTKIFSSRELEKATDNFNESRIIGEGGQGTVYKGMLVDGRSVAVKKSNVVDEDKLLEFINEVIILSQINHRHVVKLLGCCLETEVPILVYEFITNGNLFQHLHEEFDDYTVLWGVRMRIAVDIAGAFSYLHTAASYPIYHRDIKSTNILLDEKYRAKVSDFGTSRSVTIDHTHWTTLISGTVGYVDPEYYGSSHFTEKSDVYSFGVVLVELITGEKPVITISNTQEIKGLADYFRLAMKENRLFDIIDDRIRNDCKLEQVIAMAHLAMRCLKKAGKTRPDMREVSTALERICSSPEDFQVQIQIDGEERIYRDDSYRTVTSRTM